MRLASVFALLLIASAPALAQDVPDVQDVPAAREQDLWCGAAFTLAVRDVPDAAAPEVKTVTEPYRLGAEMLVGRARAAYLEFGYTEEAFVELLAETEAEVEAALSSTDSSLSPPYSFEDCAALIGQ